MSKMLVLTNNEFVRVGLIVTRLARNASRERGYSPDTIKLLKSLSEKFYGSAVEGSANVISRKIGRNGLRLLEKIVSGTITALSSSTLPEYQRRAEAEKEPKQKVEYTERIKSTEKAIADYGDVLTKVRGLL